jgi:hypothetical protein
MDVDLKEQIAQILSPDVARQLASTVGLDDGQGKTFVDAAIPALLAGFLGSAGSGGGAKALSDAVSNADPNAIERLRRALTAHDLGPLNEGAGALTPVLGKEMRDKIANALADSLGVPVDATLPALGAVEQAVVGVIGQQDPSLWSDGESIAKFLASQRGSILSALPASLAGMFVSGEAAAPVPAPQAAPEPAPAPPAPPAPAPQAAPPPPPPPSPPPKPAPQPAPQPTRAAPPPPPPPPQGGGFPSWLIALIVIVILAIIGYYYWSSRQPKADTGLNTPTREYATIVSPKG